MRNAEHLLQIANQAVLRCRRDPGHAWHARRALGDVAAYLDESPLEDGETVDMWVTDCRGLSSLYEELENYETAR